MDVNKPERDPEDYILIDVSATERSCCSAESCCHMSTSSLASRVLKFCDNTGCMIGLCCVAGAALSGYLLHSYVRFGVPVSNPGHVWPS